MSDKCALVTEASSGTGKALAQVPIKRAIHEKMANPWTRVPSSKEGMEG